jgi:stalled ribosome rescue protein Dom34
VVQDSKYLEREKHQFRNYFNEIIPEIKEADSIVIFGPAEAKIKFKKELEENHKAVDKKVAKVETADSMTDNQVVAWVRDFYK